ncbi:type I-E CRISPR-associated protein Cse1/CasA [Streptomyces sp. NPDC059679]|uniref:type I-E CRISPR-associated protein Cse1/CasA n=1 Tax=Streptomyces sp. NPDC059679 TaxID=3346903 RepID=UPI0036A37F69
MPLFPLTTSPWIPVYDLDAQASRSVGITDALLRAHRLVLPDSAQDGPVLLRLLAAVFDAAAGPTNYDDWTTAWTSPALDAERITAYLDRWQHRLDLFHPDEPAFQSGALTEYPRDARVLHPSYLGGAGGAHFNHILYAAEEEFPAWEPAEAARNLLILNGYDVAGIKRAAPGDPAAKQSKVYGAQLAHIAQITHVNVRGRTLKDTLLLNLPPQPRRAGDAPVWERPTPDAAMVSRKPTGRLDMLTWPSRRMRLHANPQGQVDVVAWHDGDRLTDGWQQIAQLDPMSMWRTGKDDRWIPQNVTDQQGLIIPWQVAQLVLDPSGDESGWAMHSGAAQHLARLLDDGVLADYGPLSVAVSCVQHTNPHKSVISDVPSATVPLATGEFLTSPEDRADLAASARTASAYLARIRHIIREIAPPHTPYDARLTFMTLYDRWPEVASLLFGEPVDGRRAWRSMLREHADHIVQALPLRSWDKEQALAEIRHALDTTRFVGEASRTEREWKTAPARKKKTRTGRPTSRTLTAFGQTKTIAQWVKDPRCPVSYVTLRRRAAALLDGDDATHIITTPGTRGMQPAPITPDPAIAPEPIPAREESPARPQRCVNCGRSLSENDYRSRCEKCRTERVSQDWGYRKELAEAIFTIDKRGEVLRRLAAGDELADVCTDLDLTPHRVHGFRAYDDEWGQALDQALMAGRDPDLDHGSEQAYRHGRCRCPECREAHDARRGPRQ